jgi:hypothetical protein
MKKLTIALFAVAFGLVVAGAAFADTDINVYGASAQFNFWSAQAQAWLESPTGGGCTIGGTKSQSVTPTDNTPAGVLYHGAKYFMAQDTSCANDPNGGGTITLRVTAFDSYDGLGSVSGQSDPFLPDVSTTGPWGMISWPGATCTGNQRTMLNSTSAAVFPTNYACETIILGATDVTPDLLVQTAQGTYIDGPKTTAFPYNFDLTAYPLPLSGVPLNHYQPVVVPFGIFVNKGVTETTCIGGTNAGAPCSAAGQCNSGSCALAVPPQGAPWPNGAIQSLSLDMVSQLFSGRISNWNKLGAQFPNLPVAICLRVPGSGTLATFDYSIMHRTGAALPEFENTIGPPEIWFNFTSGDMMNCINNVAGAIGIADADQANKTSGGSNGGTYGPVPYNGYPPSRANIRNGLYDFYSIENLWENPANVEKSGQTYGPSAPGYHPLVVNFVDYANLPSDIPAARTFWASQAEMLQLKTGTGYPTPRAGGAGSVCVGGTNPGAICPATACTGGGVCTQQSCADYPAELCP